MLKQLTLFKSLKRSETHEKNNQLASEKSECKNNMSAINLEDIEFDAGAFLDQLTDEDAVLLDESFDTEGQPSDLEVEKGSDVLPGSHCSSSTSNVLSMSLIQSETIPGFYEEAGQTWIYPVNYPMRDYQLNIVKKALFKNTLVSLPTGLGKTFIAAVVMYNMYRWFPSGKVVFMAPTKPLVAQQIEACYKIVGISRETMGEMTGSLSPARRKQIWTSKRVLFLTPQVMQNDLARGACNAEDIKCVVFDEAHKALGNHSYCQVIRELSSITTNFRVLALTATPGDDLKAVQQVVTNLMISRIEIRSEESLDIQPYTNNRRHEKIVIPLEGDIELLRCEYLKVLECLLQRLVSQKAMYFVNADRVHKFQLLQSRSQFRNNPPNTIKTDAQRNQIEGDFSLGISLYHAFELLELHGMRNFHQYLTNSVLSSDGGGRMAYQAKMELGRNPALMTILEDLDGYFKSGNAAVDGREGQASRQPRKDWKPRVLQPGRFLYSHPKLKKLEEIVILHFQQWEEKRKATGSIDDTRVMVFSQYRESVREIADLLCKHSPLVRVMSFVGQASANKSSKGLSQKDQLEVVKKFRQGGYNTLVATCVGEEGLDIGEVDLIVCFDCSKSPIRLVQRMGRTGRKRDGRVVSLMTKGKEEQAYKKGESNKNHIHKAIDSGCKTLRYYTCAPRMVPRHIQPELHKLHLHVDKFESVADKGMAKSSESSKRQKGKGKQSRLSFGLPCANSVRSCLSDDELVQWKNKFALGEADAERLSRSIKDTLTPLLLSGPFVNEKSDSCGEEIRKGLVDVIRKESNTCVLSSNSESRPFNIGQWTIWQTAPIDTKFVGHSKPSRNFLGILELTELAQTNPNMGSNYDLEMNTFLCAEDVESPSPANEPDSEEGVTVGRKGSRRPAFVLTEDDDDDDFVRAAPKPQLDTTNTVSDSGDSPCVNTCNAPEGTSALSDMDTTDSLSSSSVCEDWASSKGITASTTDTADLPGNPNFEHDEVFQSADISDTLAVPSPPSFSELDWMDGMSSQPVSQMNTPITTSGVIPPLTQSEVKRSLTLPQMGTPLHSKKYNFSAVERGTVKATMSSPPLLLPSNETSTDFKVPLPPSTVRELSPKPTSSYAAVSEDGYENMRSSDVGPVTASTPSNVPQPLYSPSDNMASDEDSFGMIHNKRQSRKRRLMVLHTPSPKAHTSSSQKLQITNRNLSSPIGADLDDSDSPVVRKAKRKKRTRFMADISCADDKPGSSGDEREEVSDGNVVELSNSDFDDPEENWQKCERKGVRKNARQFIEGEAELSEEDIGQFSSDEPDDPDDYNIGDSFINDATIASQLTPTQKGKSRKSRQSHNMLDVYRKSLMSQHNPVFGGEPSNRGRFKMVLSQRHGILRKYAEKAGFQVSHRQSGRRGGGSNADDSFVSNSPHSDNSEAEEVLVGFGEESEKELDGSDDDFVNNKKAKSIMDTIDEDELYNDLVGDLLADDDFIGYDDANCFEEKLEQVKEVSPEINTPTKPNYNESKVSSFPSAAYNSPSPAFHSSPCSKNLSSMPKALVLELSPVVQSIRSQTAAAKPPQHKPAAAVNPPVVQSPPHPTSKTKAPVVAAVVDTPEAKNDVSSPQSYVSPGFKILRPGVFRMARSPPVKTRGESTRNEQTCGRTSQSAVGPGIIREPRNSDMFRSKETQNFCIGMREWIYSSDEEMAAIDDQSGAGNEYNADNEMANFNDEDLLTLELDDFGDALLSSDDEDGRKGSLLGSGPGVEVGGIDARSSAVERGGVGGMCVGDDLSVVSGEVVGSGVEVECCPEELESYMEELLQKKDYTFLPSCTSDEDNMDQGFAAEEGGDDGDNDLTRLDSPTAGEDGLMHLLLCQEEGNAGVVGEERAGSKGFSTLVEDDPPVPAVYSDPGVSGVVPSSPLSLIPAPLSECPPAPSPPPSSSSPPRTPKSKTTTMQKLRQKMKTHSYGAVELDSELRIYADSREISKSQIISQLRQKHSISVDVCQLGVCGFAVSYRMCVERRTVSEFTTHAAASKVTDRLKHMSLLYSKRCLIVEKDRVRQDRKLWSKPKVSAHYEQCMAQLMLSDVLVLFSDGPDATLQLLANLAQSEFRRGHRIRHPIPTDTHSTTMMKFLRCIPVVSLPLAVGLCGAFNRMSQLCQSSPQQMCEKLPSLSFNKAAKIQQFLNHKFCKELS